MTQTMALSHLNNKRPQMDGISTWAQNRHFLDNICDDKLDEMRDEIIDKLFGSTKSLLEHCIYRLHVAFSDQQQRILNELLVNLVEPTNNTKLSLTQLPDDCLSHTMSFLSNFEKGTVQHCSRAMLIAVRRPSSCCDPSNIEMNLFQLTGPCVYRNQIAELILSENTKDNVAAITLYNQHIKDDSGEFWELKKHSESIAFKLNQILIKNIKEPECQRCVIDIMSMEFDENTILCPAVNYMLAEDTGAQNKIKDEVIEGLLRWLNPKEHVGVIFDILHCDGLLQSILNYDPPLTGWNEWFSIIKAFLTTKYKIIPIRMLKGGVLERLNAALEAAGDHKIYQPKIQVLFDDLCSFQLPSHHFDGVLEHTKLIEVVESTSTSAFALSHALIKEMRKIKKEKERKMKCDFDNVLHVLSNKTFYKLRPMTRMCLMVYKPQILEYFDKYKMSSNKLKKMKRTRFAHQLSVYLGNEKLTGSLCLLYNALMELLDKGMNGLIDVDKDLHVDHVRNAVLLKLQIARERMVANEMIDGLRGMLQQKESTKRKLNVNEFKYYNHKQMKLHQKYRMKKKFKYNRW